MVLGSSPSFPLIHCAQGQCRARVLHITGCHRDSRFPSNADYEDEARDWHYICIFGHLGAMSQDLFFSVILYGGIRDGKG